MICLLADESLPRPSVARLRRAGFDVTCAPSGASDDDVLAGAAGERRILVTLDRDFGRLALFSRNATPLGVVYLRPRGRTLVFASARQSLGVASRLRHVNGGLREVFMRGAGSILASCLAADGDFPVAIYRI